MQVFRFAALILAATIAGCGQADSTSVLPGHRFPADFALDVDSAAVPSDVEPGSSADAMVATKTPVSTSQAAKKKNTLLTTGDWQTEQVSAACDAQLKLVAKLLAHPDTIAAAEVESLVGSGYDGGSLRGAHLEAIVQQPALGVFRPDISKQPDVNVRHAGRNGFANSMAELAAPLESGERHFKFKTFRISIEKDTANTTSYYLMSTRGSERAVQQNATWNCRWQLRDERLPLLLSIDVSDYEEVVVNSPQGKLFHDCTVAVLGANDSFRGQLQHGIEHWRLNLQDGLGTNMAGHHGLAIADINGDGLEDMYVCQTGGLPNRMFVRNSDGTLTDVSVASNTHWLDLTRSALLVDFDNDGDPDLAAYVRGHVVLMENDGGGHFTERVTLPAAERQGSLAAADFDHDGDLDLYLCSYGYLDSDDLAASVKSAFRVPTPYHDANNGLANYLYRNETGNEVEWKFTDFTKQAGLSENNRRFSFAASWEDYDNDGDLDLYVANDFGRNNLYRNGLVPDGRAEFTDVAADAGVEDISAGMSATWADFNNDGWMDIYVSNMFSSAGGRIAFQRRFQSEIGGGTRQDIQRHARGNSLFENNGDGSFRDVSIERGVSMGRWAWCSQPWDLNNDGREDIIVGNGMITGHVTTDL